jgi:alpha-tubulin suppressor-like RCC1 family protein
MAWVGSMRRCALALVVGVCVGCGDDAVATSDGDTDTGTGPGTSTQPPDASGDSTGDAPTTAPVDTGSTDDGLDDTGDATTTTGGPEIDPEPAAAGVSAGARFTCSVTDGVLTCWGANGCGQLGDGTRHAKAPVAIATDRTWASVATSGNHACAIDEGGALWCWGDGSNGRVGDGVPPKFPFGLNCRLEPVEIDPGTTWARVAAGDLHTCGVQTDGTMWCWGNNDSGQIGDGAVGPLYERFVPTQVAGDDWIDVFAGDQHSCGLRSNGSVWCWGAGESLDPTGLVFSSTPVQIDLPVAVRALGRGGSSRHTCAVDEGGGLWCWGSNDLGEAGTTRRTTLPHEVPLGGAAVEVATSMASTCARRDDGTVHCFGSGSAGKLGDGVAIPGHASASPVEVSLPAPAVSVAMGWLHACARTDDGVDHCWGDNGSGEIGDGTSGPDNARLSPTPAVPWGGGPVAQGFTAIAVGGASTCAVRSGELWCTGARRFGALGNDDPTDDCSLADPSECIVTTPHPVAAAGTFTTAAVGNGYACAIATEGTLWCWGANGGGQLGNPDDDALVPVQVESSADWLDVSAGGSSTCGIRSPGSLWCWGSNTAGQLGDGSVGGFSSSPVAVGTDDDWVRVVSGGDHVCGIRSGGQLWCWGRNDVGQLGQGDVGDPSATPVSVPGDWSAVALSGPHTCAVTAGGTLWCWGSNESGQVGTAPSESVPSPLQVGTDTDWAAVAVSGSTSCGLRDDGTAWCWGSNAFGTVGNGTIDGEQPVGSPTMVVDASDLAAIAGANSTMCAVANDGTAWCWGANSGRRGNDTIFISGIPTEVRDDL